MDHYVGEENREFINRREIITRSVCFFFFCRSQSNLQAELEAEKQIGHTKKRALQIATDELAKHHEAIKQHEKIVEKLEKGIEWRTLVMMRMSDENQRNLMSVAQCGIKQN